MVKTVARTRRVDSTRWQGVLCNLVFPFLEANMVMNMKY